jgi:nicotinate-nucleotide adenylyltransferase
LVGVFGGTFDPIHIGHLRGAQEVAELLGLDRVFFVPTGSSKHKEPSSLASSEDRLEMLKIAIGSNPRFSLLTYEIEHPEHSSYTYHTLVYLYERVLLEGQKPLIILGADAFQEFPKWYRSLDVLKMCHLAVMTRPPVGLPLIPSVLQGLESHALSSQVMKVCLLSGNDFYECRIIPINISSSQLRDSLATGRSVRYLIPDEVLRFIETKRLYQNGDSTTHKGG